MEAKEIYERLKYAMERGQIIGFCPRGSGLPIPIMDLGNEEDWYFIFTRIGGRHGILQDTETEYFAELPRDEQGSQAISKWLQIDRIEMPAPAPAARPPHYLLQYFVYDHLREDLQEISKPFADLAHLVHEVLPENPETSAALRRLLEAKDCAVRSKFFKKPE